MTHEPLSAAKAARMLEFLNDRPRINRAIFIECIAESYDMSPAEVAAQFARIMHASKAMQ